MTPEPVRHSDRANLPPEPSDRGRLFSRRELLKRIIKGIIASCLVISFFFFIQIKALMAFILAEFLFFTRSR